MDNPITSLDDLWPLQARLNKKAGFDTRSLGQELRVAEERGNVDQAQMLRLKIGIAVKNYLDALLAEVLELQECLSWKHWYREAKEGRQYELQDVQNARVEAVDMLFFWVSLCQLLGLEPTDIFRLYGKKLDINLRRQTEERSQADHASFEDENRQVT